MTKTKKIRISLSLLIFFLINIGIFLWMNTRPIQWINDEILWQGAFWSEEQNPQHTLSTGLHKEDVLKPFNIYHADGTFRTRQVSYFLEMLSFKFWQKFELVFLRNYTLILIHVLNAFLGALLTYYLTKSKKTGLLTGILILNSGAALASMVYPFRNAKLLVMTFFLLDWILLAKDDKKFSEFSWKRIFGFYAIMLCAVLTDEISVFFLPVIYVYIAYRDGAKALLQKRLITGLIITIGLFALLTAGAYNLSVNVIDSAAHTGEQTHYIKNLKNYLSQPVILKDISKAFFGYFLRRTYGYWDKTPWGLLGMISAAGLLLLFLICKPPKFERTLGLMILSFIFLKAFLFPHNAGYHRVFMPEGTVFPSLFFFSYYYIYAEALLFGIIFALFLKNAATQKNKGFLIFIFVSLISFSNAWHLKEGPQDALEFMRFTKDNKEQPQKMVQRVKKIRNILSDDSALPVYLSFPIGNSDIVLAKRNDPFNNLYTRMIPFMYLPSIETGTAITSIKNISDHTMVDNDKELSSAQSFYDILSEQLYPLSQLKKKDNEMSFAPTIANQGNFGTKARIIPPLKQIDQIVFFIKGRSGFLFELNDKKIEGQQVYGEAYQMFKFDDFPTNSGNAPTRLRVSIFPVGNTSRAYLVGPFVVKK